MVIKVTCNLNISTGTKQISIKGWYTYFGYIILWVADLVVRDMRYQLHTPTHA